MKTLIWIISIAMALIGQFCLAAKCLQENPWHGYDCEINYIKIDKGLHLEVVPYFKESGFDAEPAFFRLTYEGKNKNGNSVFKKYDIEALNGTRAKHKEAERLAAFISSKLTNGATLKMVCQINHHPQSESNPWGPEFDRPLCDYELILSSTR